MNATIILDTLESIDDNFILEARTHNNCVPCRHKKNTRRAILIAAIIFTLALCGFAAYELGLFDPWIQSPAKDPIASVQNAIENQANKDYTLDLRIESIYVDAAETQRQISNYVNSDLALERGWTEGYLNEHFLVVAAKYHVTYDHTKTFLDDGYLEQLFFLTQDEKTGEWIISDNTSPNPIN